MVIFNIPEWLSICMALGITFFLWSSAVLITMMIGGVANGAVRNWRKRAGH